MVLSLESDFDDVHRRDDKDGFGYSGAETGDEDTPGIGFPGCFFREDRFVEFKGGESDCHFWNDSRYDRCTE